MEKMNKPKSCHFRQINIYIGVKHNDMLEKINSKRHLDINRKTGDKLDYKEYRGELGKKRWNT